MITWTVNSVVKERTAHSPGAVGTCNVHWSHKQLVLWLRKQRHTVLVWSGHTAYTELTPPPFHYPAGSAEGKSGNTCASSGQFPAVPVTLLPLPFLQLFPCSPECIEACHLQRVENPNFHCFSKNSGANFRPVFWQMRWRKHGLNIVLSMVFRTEHFPVHFGGLKRKALLALRWRWLHVGKTTMHSVVF